MFSVIAFNKACVEPIELVCTPQNMRNARKAPPASSTRTQLIRIDGFHFHFLAYVEDVNVHLQLSREYE